MGNEKIRHILDNLDRITQSSQVPRKALASAASTSTSTTSSNNAKSNTIWAKGTGYGVGAYSFSCESTLKGNANEEKIISLLKSLETELSKGDDDVQGQGVDVLLKNSCFIPLVSGYLRNNSVLDISSHVPLYHVVLQLLRSIAADPKLRFLLVSGEGDSTISKLLVKLNDTVQNYSRLLEASNVKDLDLCKLISDVQATAMKVEGGFLDGKGNDQISKDDKTEGLIATADGLSNIAPVRTTEERYLNEMKQLQFAFMEMIGPGQVFKVPYHFEAVARLNSTETGQRIASRAKRLAQESVILSTSLPLSFGSSIFVRCDNDRLDVIKVLITGPAGTPYSNGCFEFDVHFPLDYPNSPPKVNFMTTGGNTVRFNPNLYSNGHVCLSILNTWTGGSEELWNPKSSSLLPVLVALQSMVFVDHPYFNEPGFQDLSGSGVGMSASRDYNHSIRYYTLQYAILEQMRNQTSCFKEVIQRHFWMKRDEILTQCEEWKKSHCYGVYHPFEQTESAIKWELMHMNPPEGLEDLKGVSGEPDELKFDMNLLQGLNDLKNLPDFKLDLNQPKKLASPVQERSVKKSIPLDALIVQNTTGMRSSHPLSDASVPVSQKSAAGTKDRMKGFKKVTKTKGQCCLQ